MAALCHRQTINSGAPESRDFTNGCVGPAPYGPRFEAFARSGHRRRCEDRADRDMTGNVSVRLLRNLIACKGELQQVVACPVHLAITLC